MKGETSAAFTFQVTRTPTSTRTHKYVAVLLDPSGDEIGQASSFTATAAMAAALEDAAPTYDDAATLSDLYLND